MEEIKRQNKILGELDRLLEKIIEHNLDKDDRKLIKTLTGNEKLHYTELNSRKDFFDNISKIPEAIDKRKKIETVYIRGGDMQNVTRKLCPVALSIKFKCLRI